MIRRITFLALGVALLCACDKQQTIRMAWTPAEPAAEISQLLASELAEEFNISTSQYLDSAALTKAIQNREIDLAIIEEPSKTIKGVQALKALYPSVLHVLVKSEIRQAHPGEISAAKVVAGRKVYAGPLGSAGHELLQTLVEQHIFPPLDQFTLVESVFDDEPDIYLIFGGLLSQNALARLSNYELVSLGAVDNYGRGSWAEGVTLRTPNVQPFIIPEGLYPAILNRATLSLSVQSFLVTHPDFDDHTAYNVLKKTEEIMAHVKDIYPLAGHRHAKQDDLNFNLANHLGAVRYQQREAPGFLERYAESLAFIVTLILALTSFVVAVLKIRNQARKDRIDVYFNQLLELRDDLINHRVSKEEINEKVIKLQHKVTVLVSDERIAADSAFVGFIELSNQVISESRGL